MPHVPDTITNPALRARVSEIQQRLEWGLPAADPHRRLVGRPVAFRIVSGQALEIAFRDVPSIGETEMLAVKRLIGEGCFCQVSPQTAEGLIVRFVIALE